MEVIGLIILATILRKRYNSETKKDSIRQNKNRSQSSTATRLYGPHTSSDDRRPLVREGSSGYRDYAEALSEEGIIACLKLLQHYLDLNESQRKQLEGKMTPPVKAQFYHLFNSVWQMDVHRQQEYLLQQSRNGLYEQVGAFALRYYS